MFSLIYLTNRLGGIDLLAVHLASQTNKDYELIVVDDCPGRVERGAAEKYLKDMSVNLTWYGKSKPKYYKRTRMGLCNAMNTGFIHSISENIVFVHDYIFLEKNLVELWNQKIAARTEKTIYHGTACLFKAPMPTPNDIFSYNVKIDVIGDHVWVPGGLELFHLCVPASFYEDINGVDERGDYCGVYALESLEYQAAQHDYKIEVCHEIQMGMLNHRLWDEGDDSRSPDTQWRTRGHYTTLPHAPKWDKRSPNPFNISHLRRQM